MSHRNARLTFHGRVLLIQRHQARWKQAHIAAAMGISRKCVKYWITRFEAEGKDGLHDRSSRPHSSPTRTAPEQEQAVLELRNRDRRGQDRIGPELSLPARTVSRILRRHNVPYLRDLDPMTGQLIRSSKATAIRYEREAPGDLAHMDVKKLGRIPDGGGWRANGRQNGQTSAQKKAKIGYDFVHSLIDDYSRLAYSEVLDDEKGTTCAGFLERAAAYFAAHGIARIQRVMTDNAFAYRYSTDMKATIEKLGAKQVFIKPHCPWQNGKVERFNRTLATEWAYQQPFASNQARRGALAPFIEFYNTERRHTALGGNPPVSRL